MERGNLSLFGKRRGVAQIVPPRTDEEQNHDLVADPLAAPTGPGGAAGFRNRNGSQIARPEVWNVFLGPFWNDLALANSLGQALVENGYLDPLAELNAGTGPGTFMGPVDGPDVSDQETFSQDDAESVLASMIDQGTITPNENSLYMLILPEGVTALLQADSSCHAFCGYHDAFDYQGVTVAYAVLPATTCQACGGNVNDFMAVYSHELAEACTDKVPGQGWMADDGSENGDLEAWILFNWGPPEQPDMYTIQGYYTNERGNTFGAYRPIAALA